jgi:hypothetical protein
MRYFLRREAQVGYWKQEFERQQERGYTAAPPDRFVCPACVTDPYLARGLADETEDVPCSYCGADQAAEITVLLDAISNTINTYYTDPANELPYETREGGYQGEVLLGTELVADILDTWSECDNLVDEVAQAFDGSSWCKRDYFGLDKYEMLRYSWDDFSSQVKHRTRYLFLQELGASGRTDQKIPAGEMLDALGGLFQEFGLFSELSQSTDLFRVRVTKKGDRPSTAADLGTAPREAAILPNRMSPAGIPMFYAALDERTAVLETYDPKRDGDQEIALARFRNTRPLKLLNLTSLPDLPSQFDPEQRLERDPIRFLMDFERDFTKAVARDEGAHTEYVPTQVVTEYVRHRLCTPAGERLDGVLYRSARAGASTAVVIFADPEHCGPRINKGNVDPEPFLELIEVRYPDDGEFKNSD